MSFQRARTEAQVASRQNEILNACAQLYEQGGAEGVTVKAIAARTSFSRPTIYNYYATKEEILLDLLRRECAEYTAEMERDLRAGGARSRERFCRLLTDGLTRHERMLRMMSVNLNAIENNVAEERLVAFKRGMNEWFRVLAEGLERFFPDSDARERELFLHDHFCYVYGLYPVTHPSARQVAAMEKAGFRQPECFERLCYEGLLRLTGRL